MTELLNRWIRVGLTAMLLISQGAALADQDALNRLNALQELSDRNNALGLKELEVFGADLDASTPYIVQRKYLNTLAGLQIDAARMDAAGETVEKLRAMAEANKDDLGLVLSASKSATLMSLSGKTDAALVKLLDVEPVALRTTNPEALWQFYFTLAYAQISTTKFESALSNALKSLEHAKARTEYARASYLQSQNLLVNVYMAMHNWDKALKVIEEALVLAGDVQSTKLKGTLFLNRGAVYTNLDRLDDAVESYNQSLKIGREAGLIGLQGTSLNNIADTYLIRKNFTKAEVVARQAILKFVEAGEMGGLATAQCNVGFALMGQGKLKEGAAEVHAALRFMRESGAKADEEAILGELGRMYEAAGAYREAVATIREQQTLSKELFSAARDKSVATLQEEFDSVQRQKQIELLARENSLKDAEISNRRLQQMVTLLGAAVTVMAGIFVFLLYRRVRRTNAKLREANQQLEFHSVRDPLTGLFNRRSFLDLMKKRSTEPKRQGDRREDIATDGLMILDIDHFKQINDTLGHAGGDIVLVEISKRLRTTVRDSDMVMRWGGEEFLVFSPKASAGHLQALAARILKAIGSEPIAVGNQSLVVTVTGGFLPLPFSGLTEQECNWEKAMQIADMALYLGKTRGRNRAYGLTKLLVPFEEAMPVLERDIASAIEAGMVETIEVVGPSNGA